MMHGQRLQQLNHIVHILKLFLSPVNDFGDDSVQSCSSGCYVSGTAKFPNSLTEGNLGRRDSRAVRWF